MNKNQFRFLFHGDPVIPVIVVPMVDVDNKEILDEIFKVDPATGLPRNDQEVFLSNKTNPLVKEFIASVLRNPENVMPDSTFSDLSDDVISELTIQHGESRVAYVERVSKYAEEQRAYINQSIRFKSIILEKLRKIRTAINVRTNIR